MSSFLNLSYTFSSTKILLQNYNMKNRKKRIFFHLILKRRHLISEFKKEKQKQKGHDEGEKVVGNFFLLFTLKMMMPLEYSDNIQLST